MMQDNQKSEMKKLLTRINDSCEGYRECAENTEQHRHNRMFQECASKRMEYASNIKTLLEAEGETVDMKGSMMGNAHRFITDMKNKIDNDNDESLLEEICRGEEALAEQYEETMEEFRGQENVLSIIQPQYKEVKNTRELFEIKEEAA